jgi:hypothetical membrane protein
VTAAKNDPSRAKKKLLTLAGASGLQAAIVGLVFQNLAVSNSLCAFSLKQDWYSDLGGMGYEYFLNASRPVVNSYTTEILIQSDQLIVAVLLLIVSLGLYYDEDTPSYRLGTVFIALTGIGWLGVAVFPEPLVLAHLVASYVLFFSGAMAALLIGSALLDSSRKPLGLLAIVLGIVAFVAAPFVIEGRGAAELIWSLTGLVLVIVFSVKMLRHASHLT